MDRESWQATVHWVTKNLFVGTKIQLSAEKTTKILLLEQVFHINSEIICFQASFSAVNFKLVEKTIRSLGLKLALGAW